MFMDLFANPGQDNGQTEFMGWQISCAEPVKVVPLRSIKDLDEVTDFYLSEEMFQKDCHNNAAKLVATLDSLGIDAKMVSGLASSYVPVEHSWVKVGDLYIDPTWERFSDIGSEYLSICEFTLSDLVDIWDKDSDKDIWGNCGSVYAHYLYNVINEN